MALDLQTETSGDTPAPKKRKSPAKPRKKKRGWIAVVILLLVFALLGGGGYYYMVADSLAGGEFTKLEKTQYKMPGNKARHGTVLRITQKEYDNLIKRLGGD